MEAELIKSINYLKGRQGIIGRQYIPEDNSYVADQLGRWSNLYGAKNLVIISTPYQATIVCRWNHSEHEETFINVLDTATGIRYRVLYSANWVKDEKLTLEVDHSKLIQHRYQVKDNSYIGEVVKGKVLTDHCSLIGNPNLVVVDPPFTGDSKDALGDEFTAYWVLVKDTKTDRYYRVPYYPGYVSEFRVPDRVEKVVIHTILAL